MSGLAVISGPLEVGAFALIVLGLLLVDLLFFARGREPTVRESVVWSIGWFLLSLLVALPLLAIENSATAVNYTTVYLIERTLSLDNLFVFLLLFAYFAVPQERRRVLLFWGIAAALVLRGLAILVGVELIERFDWVIYVLGLLLLALAYRMLKGGHEDVDPESTLIVRIAKRIVPRSTPIQVALVSMVLADIAFAVDSIPAAFAITTDSFVIWSANAFALMGMRALFVLVEELIRKFRYLDETLAIVLGLVGVKLLLSDVVHLGAGMSLGIVLLTFTIGIAASVRADKRDSRRELAGRST